MNRYAPWIIAGVVAVLVGFAVYSLVHIWQNDETSPFPTSTATIVDGGAASAPAQPQRKAQAQEQSGRNPGVVPAPATTNPAIVAGEYAPAPASGWGSWMMTVVLLMSVVAAALIGGLVVGWRIKDPTDELAALRRKIGALEEWRARMEASAAPRHAGDRRDDRDDRDDRDIFAIYRTPLPESPPPPPPAAKPRESKAPPAAPPPPPPVPLSEIVAGYRHLLSGTLSRASFQSFFEGIGESGPVQLTADRTSIEEATGESFLVSVARSSRVLVFPSYDFASNAANQFSTIASVPEAVSILFDLERDEGEIAMERPAMFDIGEDRLVLKSKGVIRGFDG